MIRLPILIDRNPGSTPGFSTMKRKIRNKKLYVNDTELVYEVILSQGKGLLSDKAAKMFMNIAENFMYNFKYFDPTADYANDCKQQGLEMMLKNWINFNPKKYAKAVPYFSEIFKRGATWQFDELTNKKRNEQLNVVSIERYRY